MPTLNRSAFGTFLLGGLMTACGHTATPSPTAINGRVGGWTAGAGTVSLQQGSTVLSSGILNSDGSFQVALPAASTVTPYLSAAENLLPGCGDGVTVSDQKAQTYAVSFLTVTAGGSSQIILPETSTEASTTTQTTVTVDGRAWVYADRNVKLSGSVACAGAIEGVPLDFKLTANASLHTGWNILRTTAVLTADAQGTQASLTLGLENTSDTTFTWTSGSQAAPLGVTKNGSRQAALLRGLNKMVPFQREAGLRWHE